MTAEVAFDAHVDLGEKIDKLNHHLSYRKGKVNQVPFSGQINISGGAGSLDIATEFEPVAGTIWSVRRAVAYGYTAGTVTGFISTIEPCLPFPSQGVFFLNRGALLLYPGEKLTWTASGITLAAGITAVQIFGRADWFDADYLTEYLD